MESFKTSVIDGIPSTSDEPVFSIGFIRTNGFDTHSDLSLYNTVLPTSEKFNHGYHIKSIYNK